VSFRIDADGSTPLAPVVDPGRLAEELARNPRAAAQALAKYRAETSLIDFTRLCWKVIEPGNPLRVGWAMCAIAEHLEAVSKGQIRNLLINVPPGFSKSLLTNVFWPAWEWGPQDRADLRYISWSYAEHLSKRDNERCRDLIKHPLYQALWGDRFKLKADAKEKINYKTDKLGFRLASSIKGVGTGERGDRLILDDPHSVEGGDSDADREHTLSWFAGTMTTRVRNANPQREFVDGVWVNPSSTVIIMQRVHRRDISGLIIDQGFPFEHLLIEMEYEGAAHPRRSHTGWRPSSIGYVDPRAARVAAITSELEKRHEEFERTQSTFRVASDATLETAERVASDEERERTWWHVFGETWGKVALDRASLADPVRFTRAATEEAKDRLRHKRGSNAVASQFRQWPHEGTGMLFRREDFRFCGPGDDVETLPPPGRDDCRGWDLAASDNAGADATATVKLRMDADGRIFVLHAEAVRKSPAGVEDYIRDTLRGDGVDVVQSFPQDPGSAGKHVVNFIARKIAHGHKFRSSPEFKKKTVRAEPIASQVQTPHRNVYIVRGAWNAAFISELEEFPHGLHDDLVDAVARAYDALLQASPIGEMVAPKLFIAEDPTTASF
jgi:predicted phage terminase large subunit-like protein